MQLSDEQKQRIKTTIDKAVLEFIDSIPARVEQILNGSLLQTLGIKHGWSNNYEIDHCNGNKRIIHDIISLSTKAEIGRRLSGLILASIAQLPASAEEAIMREATSLYKTQLKEELFAKVLEKATRDAETCLSTLELKDLVIGPQNTELEDPDSFDSDLGEKFMEHEILKREL